MTTKTTEHWRDHAACQGMSQTTGSYDLFFDPEREAEAKKICAECTVRNECLEFAMRGEGGMVQTWDGVLGGMNPKERLNAYRRWLHWTRRSERTKEAWASWSQHEETRAS